MASKEKVKLDVEDGAVGSEIECYVRIEGLRYPKKSFDQIEYGENGIILLFSEDVIKGKFPEQLMSSGTFTFMSTPKEEKNEAHFVAKGRLPKLDYGSIYYFRGTLIEDARWKLQYTIEEFHKVYNLKEEETEIFLRAIFTEHKAQLLIDNFKDPLLPLKEKDMSALCAIPGVGHATAEWMIKTYEQNFEVGTAYVQLSEYGLTPSMIKTLQDAFKSVDTVLYVLQNDPYCLIDLVSGIGWKKADAIAANAGNIGPTDEKRVKAYVKYFLKESTENYGHSWVPLDYLVTAIQTEIVNLQVEDLLNMLRSWIVDDENGKAWLYYDKSTNRIGLSYYRQIEERIAKHLTRLEHENAKVYSNEEVNDGIAEAEAQLGFEYTEEQKQAIKYCLTNGVTIISGSAGCVDCDTEYFNGTEWKRIADYTKGDKVLQYNEDGTAELVEPLDYVKYPETQLYRVATKYGLDMCLSAEHNVYYITSKGNLYHKSWADVLKAHQNTQGGFSGKFITSFKSGGKGMDLTNAQIKVMLAVIADGSFTANENSLLCRFHIKKERKKIELRKILKEAGIEWKEHISVAPGYIDFYITAPRKEKEFSDYWYNCSQEQLQLICDNILKWDGSVANGRKSFSTTLKQTADFVQYAFTACGYRAVIKERDRRGIPYDDKPQYIRKSLEYEIIISNRTLIGMGGCHPGNPHPEIEVYTPKDGYKYCFTVPTHMWVMRRNGKIVVTGNTGKSTLMKAVTQILQKDNRTFRQCSLSGKAASNLTEVTGIEGMTIHRLLNYNPEIGRFMYDANHPLSADAIIVDELSLIGGELFLQLLEAIPNGCKLICLGDEKQLESIGMANLLKDCINSNILPAQRLIKIHRQAAKSGIITESLRASAQEQIVTHSPGVDIRGELEDFKIISSTESALVADNFLEEYRRIHFDEHIPVKDIMGISPLRDKGDISCLALNKRVQALVNPIPTLKDVHVGSEEKGFILREGDKVLVVKNDYKVINADANVPEGTKEKDIPKLPIFNGNTGFVEEINKEKGYVIIDLLQGRVKIPFDKLNTIELGYVITAHKSQGSGSPYVVVALTMSAYALLSKEWIYTALTRAKRFCTLCTQISAARQAVTISRVQVKHTWLQELLINYEKEYQATGELPTYDKDDYLSNYLGRSKEFKLAYNKTGKGENNE